jgi:F0F1-type ATP synthase epsilon subunit
MKLKIITPISQQEYQTEWVEFNTASGNFVILKGHAPLLVSLTVESQVVIAELSGKKTELTVSGGFAKVSRSSVELILDTKPQ